MPSVEATEPLPIVIARQIGRKYGQHSALRQVSLRLTAGERLGIVGPDGAGKTTLLQIITGILDPTEGDCQVFGLDSRKQSKRIASRLGYMTQGFTLYDRLSVDENLELSARLRGVDKGVYTQRREQLLSMAALDRFTGRPAGKLSGGMRKKLSLCTNLIHEPALLILDEPGLGVDPLSRRQLWDMLDRFRAQGVAMIIATSYMDEATRCDRVALLHQGELIAMDAPAAIRSRAAGRVFEVSGGDTLESARALSRDPAVRSVQVLPDRVRFQTDAAAEPSERFPGALAATPTLEDVFVLLATGPDKPEEIDAGTQRAITEGGGFHADAVTIRFGDFRAVDAVSLRAKKGEMLALLGPNGAGKTTLIRALCGLVRLSEGKADIGGYPLGSDQSALHQRIGYMSQRFSLYLDLTAAENLSFFAAAYGLAGQAKQTAIEWACAQTGTHPDVQRLVSGLSGAEQQRLALACSILHRPAVLFLDEPTSGVDPLARHRFWRLIRTLAAAGMTILVTTHYLDEAAYCDRIGLMHHGRLIAQGSLAELRQHAGTAADADVETVFVRLIERAGAMENST